MKRTYNTEKMKRPLPDELVVEEVISGNKDKFEVIMRKYNQQLYRIARAYGLRDDDCEDVIQQTYVNAYRNLQTFRKESKFSSWLIRILINECLSFKRKYKNEGLELVISNAAGRESSPEFKIIDTEMKNILEEAIEKLPEKNRVVFMMQEIEDISGRETAEILGLTEANVRVINHRSKEILKTYLIEKFGQEIYPFGNERCNRVVNNVLKSLN